MTCRVSRRHDGSGRNADLISCDLSFLFIYKLINALVFVKFDRNFNTLVKKSIMISVEHIGTE
jgi:hypothetical protein